MCILPLDGVERPLRRIRSARAARRGVFGVFVFEGMLSGLDVRGVVGVCGGWEVELREEVGVENGERRLERVGVLVLGRDDEEEEDVGVVG